MTGETGQPEDRAMVEAFLRSRDETAFRTLYRRHAPALYLLALRLLGGNAPEAEEAVQEAWLRAFRSLDRFEFRSSLRTWLCAILINCTRQLLRTRSDGSPVEEIDPPAPRPIAIWTRVDLEGAIRGLPPGYRQVLVLHDIEGLRHDEIAAMLEITEGASKSQLFHARAAVRQAMGSPGPRIRKGAERSDG